MNLSSAQLASIAAHRFGLGEARLATVGEDAHGWLLQQIGPADPQRAEASAPLVSSHEGLVRLATQNRDAQLAQAAIAARVSAAALAPRAAPADAASPPMAAASQPVAAPNDPLRSIIQGDVRARLATAATTTRPFAERLALFWGNHFTVSALKGNTRTVVGAFHREAIRPHIAGSFDALLLAAVTHPAMLRFLDNELSAGPQSRFARTQLRRPRSEMDRAPRITGLNENLAREVLELHTLGAPGLGLAADGGASYTQADVTSFARVLTGWRVPIQQILREDGSRPAGRFDATWHEPGEKVVLGRRYGEGEGALAEALRDFTRHPATARHIATKLARHFVADVPPPALVDRLARRFHQTQGDLAAVYRELLSAPEAWSPQPVKLKTPEEFVISTVRVLGLGEQAFQRAPDGGIGGLGQRVHAAPSPAGWPDRADEWLGPDAVWKRVEWSLRVAERVGSRIDARALARDSLGPQLGEDTRMQIERAADGVQAVALLLMAPEFQRR